MKTADEGATPWALVSPKGIEHLGLHRCAREVWMIALGYPDEEEVGLRRRAGWKAVPVKALYEGGGEYWKPPIGTSMLPLMRENAQLRAQLISIAYVDEVPQVQQGEPNHEVLELLDAETVRGFITTIERLTRERETWQRSKDAEKRNGLREQLAAVEKQRDELLALLLRAEDAIEALDGTSVENEKLVDDYRALIEKVKGVA